MFYIKKKNVNTNTIHNQLSTNTNISTNQMIKNTKISKIEDKSPRRNRNNKLRMSKSTSNVMNYGKKQNDTFDRKGSRINGIIKYD